jgi:hypothetical protein
MSTTTTTSTAMTTTKTPMMSNSRAGVGLAALLALGLAWPGTARAADQAAFQKILKDHAETVVTVKLVLTIKGGYVGPEGQEIEHEANALIIDPHGLVLTSSTELGGIPPALRQMMGQMGAELSVVPSDIKVLVGDDTEGLEAELLARDSELDLAWVQIKDPGGRVLPAVDLSKSVEPKLGQPLLAVTRMSRYFDRAPVVEQVRIAGITSKPRRMYVPSVGIGDGFCTPVYTTDGVLVGVTVLQVPDVGASASDPLSAASLMGDLESMMGGFILPAADVRAATKRAQATAEEKPEQAAEGPE